MDVYMGMIICVGFNFVPTGFAPCDGRLLSIAQNSALFSLLGTQYGGDGVTTFGLPDLRSRVAVGFSGSVPGLTPIAIGEKAGVQQTTLLSTNMPAHTHALTASSATATEASPASNVLATATTAARPPAAVNGYAPATSANTTMAATAVQSAGGGQPFPILNPYLGLNFLIATQGIYPSRS